ncbi:TPM domain-containing protein [Sphingobium sp. AN641]|uniref:TPM domain-containing protein n=1 Tax=Sphingobium sp. AN641 TaxID=3133443 RepID=UPI0030C5E364
MIARLPLFLTLLAFAPAAQGQSFPALSGRVVDAANILDPAQEATLTQKLATLEQQSGRQLVVATIADLQGHDIADYGYRLGRDWQLGSKDKDDGALLIVAPNDRKVRIEVGYGLEGILTDALSSRIIRNAIAPRFKAGDYPGGIDAGVSEIGTLLTLPPEEAAARAKAAEAQQRDGRQQGGVPVMLIFWGIMLVAFLALRLFGRQKGQRYRGGTGPVILWGPGDSGWGGGSSWGSGDSGWGGGGGFSGGGGSFGGGGASGDW